MTKPSRDEVKLRLKQQRVETPSWGYADSGTRFGVFRQLAAADTLEHKLEDAADVHRYTGICPTVAIHIPWDLVDDWDSVVSRSRELGIRVGAVNPNLFQEQEYKLGSVCNPDERIRTKAVDHILECIHIARRVRSRVLSLWVPDGTSYPGQDSFKERKERLADSLRRVYEALDPDMKLLIEYKFFEPYFYHTDIGDWGTAFLLADKLGPQAQVLVDLGHHPLGTNIEQIVALLLHEGKLGGFHFNSKKYADDDLTVGSINPYELFLIYTELVEAELDERTASTAAGVEYMIDQSHNLKDKVEATIQSVAVLQESYARALLLDRDALADARREGRVLDAEECMRDAFHTDVRPLLREVREEMGLDPDPVSAYRRSGLREKKAEQRT